MFAQQRSALFTFLNGNIRFCLSKVVIRDKNEVEANNLFDALSTNYIRVRKHFGLSVHGLHDYGITMKIK